MKTSTKPENFQPVSNCLKDKVILITGATGGYGKVMSLTYAAAGATIILLGKNVRLLENLYDEIEKAGYPTPAIYPLNLEGATEKDYYELFENINKEFGRLDGLLHTAALLGAPTPFEHSDSETWFQVMQVNLNGPYLLTKHCIPLLTKSKHSSLLFMTDDKFGAYWDAYAVSKGAVNSMMSILATEYDGSPLFVNAVNPGKSRTALHIRAFPASSKNDGLPKPEQHSDLFLYLMSNELDQTGFCFTP
ncbi:MAG: SDR family NAD(P)-dependent oxidoreductase [Gammaproteobacteria bacterium]|jgi:NAD(P)-dependent dehydrogenase (short-subunit alcohol dehydrogenase family)|nr:SDR family NAD(P)-dependent oxidoreductase [Gammaproteobacteria bacterium]MBT3724109.1 SDR family NAD(P)-dependent oxidoreductase [Gammaproteobacteria bacterium]MBT4193916.1 SDR family NAD(P)-dependent oxidoreductase [Gammaproteobacteria bacterium]MBT4448683.1 SDR family NAD(P)-dependent oxidoreductase [Gammaproteobacteria bacterium]MBT6456773.1 SDR family NAD(P)-dependent oxidoreductase [Gammaproteobacteria bacterium]